MVLFLLFREPLCVGRASFIREIRKQRYSSTYSLPIAQKVFFILLLFRFRLISLVFLRAILILFRATHHHSLGAVI